MAVSTANIAPSAGIIGYASTRTSLRSSPRTTRLTKTCPMTAAATVTASHPTSSAHSGAETSQLMSACERHAVLVARRDDDFVPEHVIEVLQHPFHGDRLQPARTVVERVVEVEEHAQQRGDRRHDGPHQEALHHRALAAIDEEQ